MPDPRFHRRTRSFTLKEISDLTGAAIADNSDPSYRLEDVAPLDSAGPGDITFLDNRKYKAQFQSTKAGACIVKPEFSSLARPGLNLLLSPSPYMAYALAARHFYPDDRSESFISPKAIINSEAGIGKNCIIEDGAIVKSGAVIGDECTIEANTVIGENVRIGNKCRIGPGAIVTHALIGNNVRLYPGACIGQDGFGFATGPTGHVKIPQLGRVIIEDNVEVGANTTIDRGSGGDTVVGQGTWIDNLVQVAHNVKIGRNCMIAAQVGISGSVVIGDFVALGGQSGLSGHISVGKGARIAGQSGVISNVPAGQEYMGYPAMPLRQFLRGVALLKRLINKQEKT